MRGPEFGTKIEKEQFVGYSHNFMRYVNVNGQPVDRLEQSFRYGFLSPKEAQRLAVPYRRNISMTYSDPLLANQGFKDPDNVIFLFPLKGLDAIPRWHNAVFVVFDHTLEVLSWEEMREYQGDRWPHCSPTHGEVYMLGRIDPSYVREIRLPNPSEGEIQDLRKLVSKHVPDLANKIVVR